MVLIGYARVSTTDQNLDMQRDALDKAGCERIFEDTASGAKASRPQFDRALETLREGDVLVVYKLDRLGRSLKHLIELGEQLRERGIGLKVIAGDIDTTTPAGRMIFGFFATLAEFERELIRERTAEGLKAARARGRNGGRPRKMTKGKLQAAIAMMSDRDNSATTVAEELGVGLSTLYAYVDGRGQPKKLARRLLEGDKDSPQSAGDADHEAP